MASVNDKLETIKRNVAKVYEAGRSDSSYEWWDKLQNRGDRSNPPLYNFQFNGSIWTDELFTPVHPIYVGHYTSVDLFHSSGIRNIKVPVILASYSLISNLFYDSKIECISELVFEYSRTSDVEFENCFYWASNLHTVNAMGTIPTSINFSSSPLTVDSMKSIISCLLRRSDYSQSIGFSWDCWAELEASGPSPNGGTWESYVNDLGWLKA